MKSLHTKSRTVHSSILSRSNLALQPQIWKPNPEMCQQKTGYITYTKEYQEAILTVRAICWQCYLLT